MSIRPDPDDLLAKRLKALPALKAPATLLPRVLAAAKGLPWWKRAWWTWPAPLQLAYAGLLALPCVLALGWLVPSLHSGAASFMGEGAFFPGLGRTLAVVAHALALVLKSFKLPLLGAAFLSYVATVAAGAAISRLWSCGGLQFAVPGPRRMS
ncbi:MAG: hypothetical protein HZB91_03165 [Elusimicrobia bacterium]|nr:hypothetical protein [Elusimicrobiota bacterium]